MAVPKKKKSKRWKKYHLSINFNKIKNNLTFNILFFESFFYKNLHQSFFL